MFKLYHYSTWGGKEIYAERELKPSNVYLESGPPLVWLTENEDWESSIQASSPDYEYNRWPSAPILYGDQGIPCWKFEVEVRHMNKIHYPVRGWVEMLQGGIELGADIAQWHWTPEVLEIKRAFKFENDEWRKL